MLETPVVSEPSTLEWLAKVITPFVTLFVSLTTLVFSFLIFRHKDKKEDRDLERRLKIDWFKTLILDANLEHFYTFFDDIEKEMKQLSNGSGVNQALKQKVDGAIKDHQRVFRMKFVDSLLAVDETLYDNIQKIADGLTDKFTESIFDSGINLSHPPKFEELVIKPVSESKTEMIKQIFAYKG